MMIMIGYSAWGMNRSLNAQHSEGCLWEDGCDDTVLHLSLTGRRGGLSFLRRALRHTNAARGASVHRGGLGVPPGATASPALPCHPRAAPGRGLARAEKKASSAMWI